MVGTTTLVNVGRHRIEATVFGSGQPTVVIEPGFGGSAEDWHNIAAELAEDTTVVTYDRPPYGASSPAVDDRTPREIARDLHGVLEALDVTGPLVLVGHSAGGRIVRAFTSLFSEQVAGMVLVDSSHEAQQQLLVPYLSRKARIMEALLPPRLLLDRHRKMSFAGRRSMIRELRAYSRQTAADQPLSPGALGDRPLIVLTRGPDDYMPVGRGWNAWRDLHKDLARLSANSRHVIVEHIGHNMHLDDPVLVTSAIRDVVLAVRTGKSL